MKDEYIPGSFNWNGRVDGDKKEQLRFHQVVKNIDIKAIEPKTKGFCIIGFKSELGVKKNKGRSGAKEAPDAIRKKLASLPWHFDNIDFYDAGDIVCENSLENAQSIVANIIKTAIDKGLFPIVIGGGHESAFGSIKGIYDSKKTMPSIINFDAHFDMRDYSNGASSGTSFRQLGDICKKSDEEFRYLCIGIQKSSNTQELFNTAKSYKAQWIDTDMIRFNQQEAIKKLDEFTEEACNIHISVCMDVFAQSIAPGVSAPQPFGISTAEFLKFFYYAIKSGKVRSFDMAEVSPVLDLVEQTSSLAAHIIFRLMDKTAQRLNIF